MIAQIENGGLESLKGKPFFIVFKDLLFFNKILTSISKAEDIDELHLQMGTLYMLTRLHNGRTEFTYGFNEERTEMEVYQDGNPKRLILVKSE